MTAGDIYTIAGNGASGYSGDGGPATSAKLNTIGFYNGVTVHGAVAVDSAGDVIIADTGNWRIRIVAAQSGTTYGQTMTAGDIYTVAGDGSPGFAGDHGPAVDAELRAAGGVAVDSAGNLLIADGANDRIRMVAAQSGTFYGRARTAGYIYTIAGNGQRGFLGDTGPATSARLNVPVAVAASGSANVLIADNGNDRVRLVSG